MALLLKVALTGGIATGKTYVRRRFAQHGLPTLDADELARDVPKRHSDALDAIVRRFGQGVLHRNGTLNRRALGTIIFKDPAARQELETIIHPAVYRAIHSWFEHEDLMGRHRIGIADIPLLFETGRAAGFDRIIATWCREDQQVARVMARDQLTEEEARQRIAAQMPASEKVKLAHYVIDTSGTLHDTDDQVDDVYDQLAALVEPEQPAEPTEPAESENPGEPGEPGEPEEPGKPGERGEPGEPERSE